MRDDEVAEWLSEREHVVTPEERSKARQESWRRREQDCKRKAVLERLAIEQRKRRLHVEPAPCGRWAVADAQGNVLAVFATNVAAWAWMRKAVLP
jgi:hypothetical protein